MINLSLVASRTSSRSKGCCVEESFQIQLLRSQKAFAVLRIRWGPASDGGPAGPFTERPRRVAWRP